MEGKARLANTSLVAGNSAGKTGWPADRVERWPIGRLIPYADGAKDYACTKKPSIFRTGGEGEMARS
jgi:hypothetical protein